MKKLLFLIIFMGFLSIARGQYALDTSFVCGFDTVSFSFDDAAPFVGRYKPTRSDTSATGSTPSDAYFPVLIVFVQYADDGNTPDWTAGSAPTYLSNLISTTKKTVVSGEWWNTYNETSEFFSAQWLQMSRGKLHCVGNAYSVVLSKNHDGYTSANDLNKEIWDTLTARGIDWTEYDRWKDTLINGERQFLHKPDQYVDMIYKVQKQPGTSMPQETGFAALGGSGSHIVLANTTDTVKVEYGFGEKGSGLTLSYGGTKNSYLGALGHEHFHYTYAHGHITYGRVSYGVGFDTYLSPYEMVAMEYMTPTEITFGQTYDLDNYALGVGEILKVPIQGDEFFLIANRRKGVLSDRVMLGDTALYDPYNTSEYGKGVYIYHVPNGVFRPFGDHVAQDLECADGYWNWGVTGHKSVDLDCWTGGLFTVMERTTPRYDNDASALHTTLLKGDGQSLHYKDATQNNKSFPLRHGRGKSPATNCVVGTDKLFTNDTTIYSNFEHMGDRFDAWNAGYNEVFSPYSSPSTDKWNDDTSQIFVWYKELHHTDIASISFYRATYNGYTLDSILKITPPSRPMGLKDTACVFSSGQFRPKILWNHNMEPDMERGGGLEPEYKRYKVYRSVANDMTAVPPDALINAEDVYTYVATVDIGSGVTPFYIDTAVISACYLPDGQCPPDCWVVYPIRYRVIAVDKYDDESVASDFACTKGIRTESGDPGGKDNDNISGISTDSEIPKEFTLKQNYPNPFNPSTNIQFDLPKDRFVTIKIYDITGKEVAVLINEFKKAGSYIVAFDGSSLSSGIYYYTIKAENFKETKRMVLLK